MFTETIIRVDVLILPEPGTTLSQFALSTLFQLTYLALLFDRLIVWLGGLELPIVA